MPSKGKANFNILHSWSVWGRGVAREEEKQGERMREVGTE
jgi:hypothetical protein